MEIRIEPLSHSRRADFELIHRATDGECSRCMCTAHYGGDWMTRGEEIRHEMFERGEMDGYLLYVNDQPSGWCQSAPLIRFPEVASRFLSEPNATAVTCMVIRRECRGRGLAARFLRAILDDLAHGGAAQAIAVGHRPEAYADEEDFMELPVSVCEKAGMRLVHDDPVCPLYAMTLSTAGPNADP